MFCTRRVISAAARRVKVRRRIRPGATPVQSRYATRWARVLVFPVPAPAMMSNGPPLKVAAARCCSLRDANQFASMRKRSDP